MQEYIPKYFPLHIVDYCFDKGQVIIKFVTCDFAKKYAEDLEEDKFYDFYLSKDKLIINTVAFCEQIGREFW